MSAPAAAALLLIAAAPASADPPPTDPDGVTPVAAAPGPAPAPAAAPWAAPAPVGPAGPPPPEAAAPAVDAGRVAPAPPATMTTSDGAVLTVFGEDESRKPVPALTTAITTRDYDVDGVFRGSITGSAAPAAGVLEVGYQIGCGIDMGTGPGVLIGGNLGGNAILGLAGAVGIFPWNVIPNVGITGGGIITVALKPGIVNTIPVTKKQFKGESPRVAIRDVRVKIDGCVGESFIRSYAVLARVTDEKDTILAWYGETTRV